MNKLRWGKFYWSDWADDPALALCSLAAQGLWMRLLCIAAQGTPYGHVTVNGKTPSLDDLAKLIRPRPKLDTITRLIAELEHRGVVERAPCGCLVSRRMESDGKLATVRRNAAYASHSGRQQDSDRSPTGVRSESDRNHYNFRQPAEKAGNVSGLHMQKNDFASTELEAELEAKDSPRSPPKGGRARRAPMNGGRKESRNGFTDIAADMIREHTDGADDACPSGARVVDLTRHLGGRKHLP